MKRIRQIIAAAAVALCAASAHAQTTINTGAPATNAGLNSLVVRQLALAAASDINAIIGMHASVSLGQCPSPAYVGEDCLVTGVTPYLWYKWTGSSGGWGLIGSFDPASGIFTVQLTSSNIIASPPLAEAFSSGVVTLRLNTDSNFALCGSNLCLNSIPAGNLIANATSGSAEPTLTTLSALNDQNYGTSAGAFIGRGSSAWGSSLTGAFVPTVNFNAASLPSALTGAVFNAGQTDGISPRVQLNSFAAPSFYTGAVYGGTLASPAAVTNGTQLTGINALVWNGATLVGPIVSFRTYAAENIASGHQGSKACVATTPNASTTLADSFCQQPDGGVTIGGVSSLGAGTLNVATSIGAPAINVSGLTASRLVATDVSKNLVSTITAANLASSVSGITGSGNLVFGTSPSFITPALGVAAATSVTASGLLQAGTTLGISTDVLLNRDAANILALRNGTAAQAFCTYNTFTDPSNFESGCLSWTSTANWMTLKTSASGTGSARGIILAPANSVTAFGGATSSFPALIQSGAVLGCRLADNSGDCTLTAKTQAGTDSTTNVATTAQVQAAIAAFGTIVGPASAVSGNIATYNGTSGKVLQDGGIAFATGTFTPTLAFATPGTSSWTYTTQNGFYTKIGNLVFVEIDLTATPTMGTGASGDLLIGTLPFSINAATSPTGTVGGLSNTWTWPASRSQIVVRPSGVTQTSLVMVGMGTGNAPVDIGTTNMTGGSAHSLRLTITYQN